MADIPSATKTPTPSAPAVPAADADKVASPQVIPGSVQKVDTPPEGGNSPHVSIPDQTAGMTPLPKK